MSVKEKIIANGVKNLKEFGFPGCTKDNILTDDMYKSFFESMLKDNLGKGFDDDINALLAEIRK